MDVKLTHALDLVAKPLGAHRVELLGREKIQHAAAHRELEAVRHLRHALPAGITQPLHGFIERKGLAAPQREPSRAARGRNEHVALPTAGGERDNRGPLLRETCGRVEVLGGLLRIGDRLVGGTRLGRAGRQLW